MYSSKLPLKNYKMQNKNNENKRVLRRKITLLKLVMNTKLVFLFSQNSYGLVERRVLNIEWICWLGKRK